MTHRDRLAAVAAAGVGFLAVFISLSTIFKLDLLGSSKTTGERGTDAAPSLPRQLPLYGRTPGAEAQPSPSADLQAAADREARRLSQRAVLNAYEKGGHALRKCRSLLAAGQRLKVVFSVRNAEGEARVKVMKFESGNGSSAGEAVECLARVFDERTVVLAEAPDIEFDSIAELEMEGGERGEFSELSVMWAGCPSGVQLVDLALLAPGGRFWDQVHVRCGETQRWTTLFAGPWVVLARSGPFAALGEVWVDAGGKSEVTLSLVNPGRLNVVAKSVPQECHPLYSVEMTGPTGVAFEASVPCDDQPHELPVDWPGPWRLKARATVRSEGEDKVLAGDALAVVRPDSTVTANIDLSKEPQASPAGTIPGNQ